MHWITCLNKLYYLHPASCLKIFERAIHCQLFSFPRNHQLSWIRQSLAGWFLQTLLHWVSCSIITNSMQQEMESWRTPSWSGLCKFNEGLWDYSETKLSWFKLQYLQWAISKSAMRMNCLKCVDWITSEVHVLQESILNPLLFGLLICNRTSQW